MDLTPLRVDVTIVAAQSLSSVADLGLSRLHRIDMPADWTAASITLQASEDGIEFNDVFLDTAEYVISTAAGGRSIIVDPSVAYAVRYWRARSGTSSAAVAQAADRILQFVTDAE